MKAAIYSRYSTENQDAASLEGQERVCRAHAERLGCVVVNVYSDAAISGTTTKRPGLQRLLADAHARKFKALIVSDLSRLSRDRVDSGVLVRQLADHGVRVLDVETQTDSDDDSSDTIHAVKGIVNAEFVKAIRLHTHRNLQTRALAGFNPGGRAYGYTSVEESNPQDPTNPRHRSKIDEAEAAVVRRIFDEAKGGKSPREIAFAMNEEKIPAPHDSGKGNKRGHGWGPSTIRAMLQSRRYVGETRWNTTKWKKTSSGTRKPVPRPESEHVIQQHPELAIIDADTFNAIAKRYQARKTGPTRPRVVPSKHALSGLLTCGVCGGTFGVVRSTKEGYRMLGCRAFADRGAAVCANSRTISDRKVIKALGAHLRDHMGKPDRLEKFIAAFQAQYSQREKAGADPRAEILAKVEKARQTIAQATQALILVPTSQAMAQRLQAEERALEALEAQLEAIQPARPKVVPHPAAVAAYVARLADVLEAGDLVRAGDILRTALSPFKMIPEVKGYRLSGALNLGLSVQESSGGVI
jgi:site-specific DNA recombinase